MGSRIAPSPAMRIRLARTGENSSRRRESDPHQVVETMEAEAEAEAAAEAVEDLDVATVPIPVKSGVKAMRPPILVQFVGFRESHMHTATRPTTDHSAVGIPPIPPSIILQP